MCENLYVILKCVECAGAYKHQIVGYTLEKYARQIPGPQILLIENVNLANWDEIAIDAKFAIGCFVGDAFKNGSANKYFEDFEILDINPEEKLIGFGRPYRRLNNPSKFYLVVCKLCG